MNWQGFSRAHTPSIEGLRHGGVAQHMRRAMTAFGSGWRGLAFISAKDFEALAGPNFILGTISDVEAFKTGAKATDLSEQTRATLQELYDYNSRTGFKPIIANPEKFDRLPSWQQRTSIRHERIHALDYAFEDHRFVAKKLKEVGGLKKAFLKASRNELTQYGLPPDQIEKAAREQASRLEFLYRTQPMERAAHARMLRSETLAYGHQDSKTFFREARAAGIRVPQIAEKRPAPVRAAVMKEAAEGAAPSLSLDQPFDASAWEAADEAGAEAVSLGWKRFMTRRNVGIAAGVGLAALAVHEIKRRGEHRSDHTSAQQPLHRRGSGRMSGI